MVKVQETSLIFSIWTCFGERRLCPPTSVLKSELKSFFSICFYHWLCCSLCWPDFANFGKALCLRSARSGCSCWSSALAVWCSGATFWSRLGVSAHCQRLRRALAIKKNSGPYSSYAGAHYSRSGSLTACKFAACLGYLAISRRLAAVLIAETSNEESNNRAPLSIV